jgi:hypothetical protein
MTKGNANGGAFTKKGRIRGNVIPRITGSVDQLRRRT